MSRNNVWDAKIINPRFYFDSAAKAAEAWQDSAGTNVGAVNAATGLAATTQLGSNGYFDITFTLTAFSLTVTDAAGSGSSASAKLYDFATGILEVLGSAQVYTAFAEGAALTGAQGDAAFVMALGTVAADAGDGALTGTEVDIGGATATITLSGGTGTGSKYDGAKTPFASAAKDLYLNWSGSAATIDANSTIAVTGTVRVWGRLHV